MKVVRSSEVAWKQAIDHGRFSGRRKALGGDKLSASLWELPPGKTSFPLHVHHVTEEAMYVISGRAKVRTPAGETAVGPGDFVSFPAGGTPHQLVNDGGEPLVYLALSAAGNIDVVEYPDSNKMGVSIGGFPGGRRAMFRMGDQPGYWEDEE